MRLAGLLMMSFAMLPARGAYQCGDCVEDLNTPIQTADRQDAGVVKFHYAEPALHITMDLKGLAAGEYAVELHQNPRCDAPKYTSSGGLFDAGKRKKWTWARPSPIGYKGDLPHAFVVRADGTAHDEFSTTDLSLGSGLWNSIYAGESLLVVQKDTKKIVACGIVSTGD